MSTTTGIKALDIFLGGGLPDGFCTVLMASAGSGAEIFAKQFASHAKAESLFVSTEETTEEVENTLDLAGWPRKFMKVIDLQTDFANATMDAQSRGEPMGQKQKPKFDPRELVEGTSSADLLKTSKRHQRPAGHDSDYLGRLISPFQQKKAPARMVVHSLDFFLNLYDPEQVIAALTAVKASNAKSGGQLLFVVHKGAHSVTVERRLELLADCLIELEMQRSGTKFDRFLMVRKVKNRTTGIGVSTYTIDKNGFSLETLERIV